MTDSISVPTIAGGGHTNEYHWGYYISKPPHIWDITKLADTYGRIAASRHLDTTNVLFADGHVKAMKIDALRVKNLWRLHKKYPSD